MDSSVASNAANELVSRACPLCGSNDDSHVFAEADYDLDRLDKFAFASRKVPEYMHYRLVECLGCDLLYASPSPSLERLSKAYEEAAYDSAEEAKFAARTYAVLLRGMLNQLPDRRGALDIGAGDGAFLEELLDLGFTDVAGVEPSSAPIAAASQRIRPLIRHGLFDSRSFAPCSLNLVTCFQTIEHVYDPAGLIKDVYESLKPGGGALFVAHNRRSLSAAVLGLRSPIFDIEHLQLFSPSSARSLLASSGFKHVTTRTVINRYPLRYWLRLFPFPSSIKKRILTRAATLRIGALPISAPVGNLAVFGFKPR